MSDESQGPGWWMASDGKWYPPESHFDAEHRKQFEAPTPPTAAATAPVADTPRRSKKLGVAIAATGVVLVLLVVALVVVIASRNSAADAVQLEPVGFVGDDPFAVNMSVHEVTSFPTDVNRVSDTSVPACAPGSIPPGSNISCPPPSTTVAPPPPAAPVDGQARTGTAPGLYGGTQDSKSCDPAQLKAFLHDHIDKARAWASVQGLAGPDAIDGFVDSLTPVILTTDTAVTNHGFTNGTANAIPAVLQAGTAVMVDNTGVPRIKCACGNPLLPPQNNVSLANTRGNPWAGYNTNVVVHVQPGPAVTNLQIVNINNGQLFNQPVGGGDKKPAGSTLPDGTYTVTFDESSCTNGAARRENGSVVVQGERATINGPGSSSLETKIVYDGGVNFKMVDAGDPASTYISAQITPGTGTFLGNGSVGSCRSVVRGSPQAPGAPSTATPSSHPLADGVYSVVGTAECTTGGRHSSGTTRAGSTITVQGDQATIDITAANGAIVAKRGGGVGNPELIRTAGDGTFTMVEGAISTTPTFTGSIPTPGYFTGTGSFGTACSFNISATGGGAATNAPAGPPSTESSANGSTPGTR